MSLFILLTGFLSGTSLYSIGLDLSHLSVIVGAILFAVSIKPTSKQIKSNSHLDASISVGGPENYVRPPANVKSANLGAVYSNEFASPAVRLGSYLIEALFTVVTLGIGWLIWSFVIWGKGTTPGHQVVKLYIVNEKTGQVFSWGQMFVREILLKGLFIPVLSVFSFGIVFLVDSFMVVRDDRKTLPDRICGSIVVQR
jgi:hypothetical protein